METAWKTLGGMAEHAKDVIKHVLRVMMRLIDHNQMLRMLSDRSLRRKVTVTQEECSTKDLAEDMSYLKSVQSYASLCAHIFVPLEQLDVFLGTDVPRLVFLFENGLDDSVRAVLLQQSRGNWRCGLLWMYACRNIYTDLLNLQAFFDVRNRTGLTYVSSSSTCSYIYSTNHQWI